MSSWGGRRAPFSQPLTLDQHRVRSARGMRAALEQLRAVVLTGPDVAGWPAVWEEVDREQRRRFPSAVRRGRWRYRAAHPDRARSARVLLEQHRHGEAGLAELLGEHFQPAAGRTAALENAAQRELDAGRQQRLLLLMLVVLRTTLTLDGLERIISASVSAAGLSDPPPRRALPAAPGAPQHLGAAVPRI